MNRILASMCAILLLAGCPGGHLVVKEPPPPLVFKSCKKPIVVAIIDTGFGADDTWVGQETAQLCKFGHKDFTDGVTSLKFNTIDPVPVDDHGHGTHIAGTIDFYARQTNNSYCLVILKYYDPNGSANHNLERTVEAIDYARKIKADFINYSGGGMEASQKEAQAVRDFINSGGTFVAAAGNEDADLEKRPYYPAQEDDRVIVVGNGTSEKDRQPSSNYGKRINRWEEGRKVLMYNHKMTGTSQSAAVATGKIVAEKNKTCK